jgi:hypothetical protein
LKWAPAQTSFKEIYENISTGNPIGCRVVYAYYQGHYIVITGAFRSTLFGNWVRTEDPRDQRCAYYLYDSFCEDLAYKSHTWTDTVFAKK